MNLLHMWYACNSLDSFILVVFCFTTFQSETFNLVLCCIYVATWKNPKSTKRCAQARKKRKAHSQSLLTETSTNHNLPYTFELLPKAVNTSSTSENNFNSLDFLTCQRSKWNPTCVCVWSLRSWPCLAERQFLWAVEQERSADGKSHFPSMCHIQTCNNHCACFQRKCDGVCVCVSVILQHLHRKEENGERCQHI